jgi:hypothetical protein
MGTATFGKLMVVTRDRIKLSGLDRLMYFAPVLVFGYLAAMCAALILTSVFLVSIKNPEAIAGAGVLGLLVTTALGSVLYKAQLRDLRYRRFATHADPRTNYAAVANVFREAGWIITRDEAGEIIDARVADSLLSHGEWISVRFRGDEVWIASICDPHIGFSLVARRRCRQYIERIRSGVFASPAAV